jgi:hypothetical protein
MYIDTKLAGLGRGQWAGKLGVDSVCCRIPVPPQLDV